VLRGDNAPVVAIASLLMSGLSSRRWVSGLWAGGSQPYLGPSGCVIAPGDMMMDGLTPARRGLRPLSLRRPSTVSRLRRIAV
jgi:hypothetical protein